ncbi:L,D-transpeptidase family protein [Paenibacillus alvei]|uniref:L,D-transpeptidase family protein n=1 Tax=Paenibacillus alvei TaxID=44250 RepID=A0AAP7A0U2_PAEAL|nr:L,D-transpeptidase family protein [Paenibacillus alvei]NOJ73548.1 L,D-transpeptidase family protein [Paenibacillus alvei]
MSVYRLKITCLRLLSIFLLIHLGIDMLDHNLARAQPIRTVQSDPNAFSIVIFPHLHRLVVMKNGITTKSYHIAVGNPTTPTPAGEFRIIFKGENWGPSFGPRWLGLNVSWGHYGIHGTNKPHSIGRHVSHGCIRMRNKDVIELYEMIPIGTKVVIMGHVLGDLKHDPRNLAEGDAGGDVQLIQSRLQSAGYFTGRCDGKFRSNTTSALKRYQRDHQLSQDGVVTFAIYIRLGLIE